MYDIVLLVVFGQIILQTFFIQRLKEIVCGFFIATYCQLSVFVYRSKDTKMNKVQS